MTIMDPSTGDILAMATYPDYNLNTPFEPNETLQETWDTLSSEEKQTAYTKCIVTKLLQKHMNPVLYLKL